MPGLHQPVHFTPSAPFEVISGQLIFYDVVETDAMSRSSVLSCIVEAGGEAKLPDSITVSDFRTWLAAVADSLDEFQSERFTFMCTAIKVADAIDDKHIGEWVRAAGENLVENAIPYSSKEIEQNITQGLSSLPDHLQHQVFAAAAFDPSSLDQLLEFFPMRFHAPVLAAIITPQKELWMPLTLTSFPALKALASLPASPPSVLSFHFADNEVHPTQEQCEQICACLAQALHHHAGLTSLRLPRRYTTATSHQLLFPAMSTLTALQSLDLPEILPTLKQTLQALPQLHSLKLRLNKAWVSPTKRKRDSATPAPPNCCLAAMLSPATALTSLCLCTPRHCSPQDQGRFKAAKALSLPQLVQLTTIFWFDLHLAASFFTCLSAPLTSLQLGEELKDPQRISPASAPAVQQLLHSLAAFTQLRCFSTTLPTDNGGRNSILRTFTAALPTPLAAFRHLQSFTLAAEPTVVHRSVTLLAPAATALTQLCLGFYHPHEYPVHSQNHSFLASWPDFFAALRQLKLQHLDIDWEVHRPTGHGISSLLPLTQLTFLRLKGWSCLDVPDDGQALARMTRLQHLCLDHPCLDDPEDYFAFPYDCAAALRRLSALTSLTLVTAEGDSELVKALKQEAPPDEYLPALQQLAVSIYAPFGSTEDLVEYASGLPALQLLTVHLLPTETPEDEGEDSDTDCPVKQRLHHDDESRCPLMERREAAEEELKRYAACAGVELEINTDAYAIV